MRIVFEPGDIFRSEKLNSYGIVVTESDAIVVTGDGRSGHTYHRLAIPSDASAIQLDELPVEVGMFVRGVKSMLPDKVGTSGQIRFSHAGLNYVIPFTDPLPTKIILPNGKVLKVFSWFEVYPPRPKDYNEVGDIGTQTALATLV